MDDYEFDHKNDDEFDYNRHNFDQGPGPRRGNGPQRLGKHCRSAPNRQRPGCDQNDKNVKNDDQVLRRKGFYHDKSVCAVNVNFI